MAAKLTKQEQAEQGVKQLEAALTEQRGRLADAEATTTALAEQWRALCLRQDVDGDNCAAAIADVEQSQYEAGRLAERARLAIGELEARLTAARDRLATVTYECDVAELQRLAALDDGLADAYDKAADALLVAAGKCNAHRWAKDAIAARARAYASAHRLPDPTPPNRAVIYPVEAPIIFHHDGGAKLAEWRANLRAKEAAPHTPSLLEAVSLGLRR